MNKFPICFLLIFTITKCFSQDPIDVTDQTLKIGALKDEELWFGFAAGDKIIFNFREVDKKELKEMEIVEYPSNSKFSDFKTSKVESKTITVNKQSIYVFKFKNGAISGRICKIQIQRIPVDASTRNFNTAVTWKTVYDTTYTTEQERYLIKADTIISNLTDQVAKVHSQTDGNTTTTNFILPKNTVAWSYYIGVDQAGQEAFKKAADELVENATPLVVKIPNYGPMAALALGGVSYLVKVQGKESIDYSIVDGENVNLFTAGQTYHYLKTGTVVNDFAQMTEPKFGEYHICLLNRNIFVALNVTVKVTAIVVNQEWGYRPITQMHVSSSKIPFTEN